MVRSSCGHRKKGKPTSICALRVCYVQNPDWVLKPQTGFRHHLHSQRTPSGVTHTHQRDREVKEAGVVWALRKPEEIWIV
jgi:hypothetical protein